MRLPGMTFLFAASALIAALASGEDTAKREVASPPATQPGGAERKPNSAPAPAKPAADNLEYWLSQAKSDTRPATQPATAPAAAGTNETFRRKDALPGAIELSNGKVIPGWLYTTVEKNWEVWSEQEKRWHLVPFIAALSITAVVEEEVMEKKWRWKEMGVPERVYTGEEYPARRLSWKIHLIDDTTISGPIKGQPLWVEYGGKKAGPFILAERSKGEVGQKLSDLVYVKRIIVSRRMMDEVLREMNGAPEKK
jgi:hypothetical protein